MAGESQRETNVGGCTAIILLLFLFFTFSTNKRSKLFVFCFKTFKRKDSENAKKICFIKSLNI